MKMLDKLLAGASGAALVADDKPEGAPATPATPPAPSAETPPAPAPAAPPAPAAAAPTGPSADTIAEQKRWAAVLTNAAATGRNALAMTLLANPAMLSADSIIETLEAAPAAQAAAPATPPAARPAMTDAARRIAAATPPVPAGGPRAANEGDEGDDDDDTKLIKSAFVTAAKNMVSDPKQGAHVMKG